MAKLKVKPVKNIKAELEFPGDKSISHRALIFSSIAEGKSKILNLSDGDDVKRTSTAIKLMGIEITGTTDVVVNGKGIYGLKEPSNIIDAGNSGTTARLFCGLLSPQRFFSVITGDDSLRQRPMGRVVKPLKEMGAIIAGREDGSLLPLGISGTRLSGRRITINIPSAQVKSALMIAGLYADGTTEITEPSKSRDHTERMLKYMGVEITTSGTTVSVSPVEKLSPVEIKIPGDISSAAFFIVAGTIVKGSEIIIRNVGLNALRTGIIDVLTRMGADIKVINKNDEFEPSGTLVVKHSHLHGTTISGEEIPRVIDEIPIIAIAAAVAEGETVIRDAMELRKKESDRISSLCGELKKMGVNVQELDDGMIIRGGKLRGAHCYSHRDHRIGMALAIAGLVATGETIIDSAEWIDISFPQFKKYLKKIVSGK